MRRGDRRRSSRGSRGRPLAQVSEGYNIFGRRLTRRIIAIGMASVALVLFLVFVLPSVLAPGPEDPPPEDVGEFHKSMGADHIDRTRSFTGYNTNPPTSGPHWDVMSSPRVPVECGFHDQQLRDERTVHNLEHGHIVISYNISDEAKSAALFDAVRDLPSWSRFVVVQPYAQLPQGQIAITAWEWLQKFDEVDPEGLKKFYDAHRGQGPEGSIPCR